jgi:hypothetical protein
MEKRPKNEKQDTIKKGPLKIDVDVTWATLLEQVAELVQTDIRNLKAGTFEWHWLKPVSGAWLHDG